VSRDASLLGGREPFNQTHSARGKAHLRADVRPVRPFVGQSFWAVEEVQRRLALKITDLLSKAEVWILDDSSFVKASKDLVGGVRQYCDPPAKEANCQVAVTLRWSGSEASCPTG